MSHSHTHTAKSQTLSQNNTHFRHRKHTHTHTDQTQTAFSFSIYLPIHYLIIRHTLNIICNIVPSLLPKLRGDTHTSFSKDVRILSISCTSVENVGRSSGFCVQHFCIILYLQVKDRGRERERKKVKC